MRKGPILGTAAILAAVGAVAWGVTTRTRALDVVAQETREQAVPAVAVVTAVKGAPQEEIVLPGTMQAFSDAPIYARTTGYLKKWYVDMGAHVHAGQLLADIDTPDLDQQLQQARADLATAQANARLAQTTAERYRDLITSDSVSRQDLDNANGNLEARETAVESARANVKRLEQLQSFRRIEAPFDGVITARNTDIGALVDAGASAQARELFRLGAIHKVRVFVSVPQTYAQAARPGTPTAVTLEEIPGKVFHGTLARTSNAVDPVARTMLTEVEVDNPTGEILPGAYVVVRLGVGRGTRGLTIPANTLLFRSEGLRVAVVRDGRAELVPVTIRRDFGRSVEVVSGLQPTDSVILDPADSLVSGTPVRVRRAESGAAPKKP